MGFFLQKRVSVDPFSAIHSSFVLKSRARVLAKHLLRFLPSDCTILDIGSGDGLLGYMLQEQGEGLQVHGIDVLPRAKTHIQIVPFDGVSIPYPAKSFDIALMVDVLHHTDDPMLLLREADRIARRGVIIKDHVTNGVFSWCTLSFMDWVGNARYSVRLPYNYWTESQWSEAITRLGWKTDRWEHDLGLYPKPADWLFGRRLHFIGRFTPAMTTVLKHEEGTTRSKGGAECCSSVWERAYQDFETPREEIEKFKSRLRNLGATRWSRSAKIIELFCGRGNGLHGLTELGFNNLEGADLSPSLLGQYSGRAKCYVCDCRKLPFGDATYDVVIIQGGLHHLQELPEDLTACLDEIRRVLKPSGRFVMVEPWLTPFLRFIHRLCFSPVRGVSKKVNALATMIEQEKITYEAWLSRPAEILSLLRKRFDSEFCAKRWGKLMFVGRIGSMPANHG
jgi:ubiquinone/menaquinone biosynthesis C-methylase UbiE